MLNLEVLNNFDQSISLPNDFNKCEPIFHFRRNSVYRIKDRNFIKIFEFFKHESENVYIVSGQIYSVSEFNADNFAVALACNSQIVYVPLKTLEHKPFYEFEENGQICFIESIM